MKRIVLILFCVLLSISLYADPSLDVIHNAFVSEVSEDNTLLTERDKTLIDIVSLGANRSSTLLEERIEKALDDGIDPVEIYEALMHLAPYAGIADADESLRILSSVFEDRGIVLEHDGERFSEEKRFPEGLEDQVKVAGEEMRAFAEMDPIPRTNEYLITNCFGDYYTREGLDLETREMLTLAILVNEGLEGVIIGHIGGNLNVGRSPEFIQELILQCLPYAGYPKILLANGCLQTVLDSRQ